MDWLGARGCFVDLTLAAVREPLVRIESTIERTDHIRLPPIVQAPGRTSALPSVCQPV